MPPLDHATLQAVLDKQGMPNTTENLNRIAQFAAVAPDMLDKYLGRGTDQARVGGTDAAIDRSIASTADPRLAQLAGPNPYSATLDPNTGLTNIGPGLVRTPEPTGRVTVGQPTKAPGILGDENRPDNVAKPFPNQRPTGQITESEQNNPNVDPRVVPTHAADTRPEGGGSWTNFIAPSILALFAAQMARRGGGAHVPPGTTPPLSGAIPTPVQPPLPTVPTRGPTSPVPQPGAPPAPAPNFPSGAVPMPNGGIAVPTLGPTSAVPNAPPASAPPTASARPPMAPGPGQTAADVARMQAEVDAENLQAQIKARARRSGGGGGRTSP